MNHREPPHLPAGMRRALHCLGLLLVPALTLDEGHAGTRLRSALNSAESTPYLPVLGSPSLRIQEAPPPPDVAARPASGAPPIPALNTEESSIAIANSDAARAVPATPEAPTNHPTAQAGDAATTAKGPAPILPDTTRRVIHPEDFLPYFEIPGSARQPGDVSVLVPAAPSAPAPAPIPASSATYTQTPR